MNLLNRSEIDRSFSQIFVRWGAQLLLVAACGCGSGSRGLAPVSGVVTLDGKPLAGGTVSFQPKAPPGSTIAGKGSAAKCDADGRFMLATIDDRPGAVIAEHRVAIWGPNRPQNAASDSAPVSPDMVPAKYNFDSTLTFAVPSEGTDKANFDLTSK
jgi:hypothetical protein